MLARRQREGEELVREGERKQCDAAASVGSTSSASCTVTVGVLARDADDTRRSPRSVMTEGGGPGVGDLHGSMRHPLLCHVGREPAVVVAGAAYAVDAVAVHLCWG